MKFNSRLRKVQNEFNFEYSGIQELRIAEQGLQFYSNDIVKKMKQDLKIEKNSSILDFGAGTGQLAEIWRSNYRINPICIEIDPSLEEVLKLKNFKVFQKLNQIPHMVEFIYTSNVLEHIEDDVSTLIDIKNKLLVGGKLVIYVPALPFLFSAFDISVGHYRRYSKKELIKKVTESGLEVEKCYWNDSLGVLAAVIVKLLGYKRMVNLGNSKTFLIYDRVVYPVSKILDSIIFKHLIGKNLFLVAKNSNLS
jgi:SAM-dependent methyltransferase